MGVPRFSEDEFLRRVVREYFRKVRITRADEEVLSDLRVQWFYGWNGALKEIAEIYRECGDTEMAEFYEELWRKYTGREV